MRPALSLLLALTVSCAETLECYNNQDCRLAGSTTAVCQLNQCGAADASPTSFPDASDLGLSDLGSADIDASDFGVDDRGSSDGPDDLGEIGVDAPLADLGPTDLGPTDVGHSDAEPLDAPDAADAEPEDIGSTPPACTQGAVRLLHPRTTSALGRADLVWAGDRWAFVVEDDRGPSRRAVLGTITGTATPTIVVGTATATEPALTYDATGQTLLVAYSTGVLGQVELAGFDRSTLLARGPALAVSRPPHESNVWGLAANGGRASTLWRDNNSNSFGVSLTTTDQTALEVAPSPLPAADSAQISTSSVGEVVVAFNEFVSNGSDHLKLLRYGGSALNFLGATTIAPAGSDKLAPNVIANSNGYGVAWVELDDHSVWFAALDRALQFRRPAEAINDLTRGFAGWPAVSQDQAGRYAVAWVDNGAPPHKAWVRLLAADGTPIIGAQSVSDGSDGTSDVRIGFNGQEFGVLWIRRDVGLEFTTLRCRP